MAGTIFGLGLSQQFDENANALGGCLLYLYEAGTSTPVTTYEDFGLTTGLEHPHPIVADSNGRIPAFWVADGSYRVRLTDVDGNEIFDENSITAVGASSGTATGGGTSTTSVFATGDTIFSFNTNARTGFVRLNGRTIGNAASAATERANADTEDLFSFLWANVSDTYAPVSGGRGASAAADFAANKRITLPSMEGRVPVGLDQMGTGVAAGVLTGVTDSGESGGSEDHTMTQSELVSHTHTAGSLTASTHTHATGTYSVGSHSHGAGTYAADAHSHSAGSLTGDAHAHRMGGKIQVSTGNDSFIMDDLQASSGDLTSNSTVNISGVTANSTANVSGTSSSATPSFSGASAAASAPVSGTSAATGSGTAFSVTQPYRAGTWFIKL